MSFLRWFSLTSSVASSVLTVAVVAALTSSSAQSPEATASVVGVYASSPTGRTSRGTGFLVDDDGAVVTSYHVVEGARDIVVYHGNQRHEDIVVRAFDVKSDLAILTTHVAGSALNASSIVPTPSHSLTVVGHPRGVPNQQFQARVTQTGTLQSKSVSDERGDRVFESDVPLIPLDMTLYGGMSGAPVLLNGGVVGVLCCSFEEGGSWAWAIPVRQLVQLLKAPPQRLAPATMSWPRLEILRAGWGSGLRTYARGAVSTADPYQGYASVLERYQRAQARLSLLPILSNAAIEIESVLTTVESTRSFMPSGGSPVEQVNRLIRGSVNGSLRRAQSERAAQLRALDDIANVSADLRSMTTKLLGVLRSSEMSRDERRELDDRLRVVADRFPTLAFADTLTALGIEPERIRAAYSAAGGYTKGFDSWSDAEQAVRVLREGADQLRELEMGIAQEQSMFRAYLNVLGEYRETVEFVPKH